MARGLAGILLVLLANGCTSLLPRSEEATANGWASYQEAQQAFDKIIPGVTTMTDLRALNLDPDANANIAILNYSDVLQRFLTNQSVSLNDLDRGVVECVSAKILCRGFEVNQRLVKKRRNGNFWLDLFGFRRETHISGWQFKGLVLLKDGMVVYKLTGGQPSIQGLENSQTPLGPVQSLATRVLGW